MVSKTALEAVYDGTHKPRQTLHQGDGGLGASYAGRGKKNCHAHRRSERRDQGRPLSYPGTVRELLNVYSSLKMSDLSLSEMATDAEDEEGVDEEEAQREKIGRLLEALKQAYDQSKRAANSGRKRRYRAEMRQIAGDIRFSRKLVERIKGRMQACIERIENVEGEIERLSPAAGVGGSKGLEMLYRRFERLEKEAGAPAPS